MKARWKLLLALTAGLGCGLLVRGWQSGAKGVRATPAQVPVAARGSPGDLEVVQRPAGGAAFAEFLRLKVAEMKQNTPGPAPLNEDKLARSAEEHAAAGMTTVGLYCSGHSLAWNGLAFDLRQSEPALSRQISELARELAVGARPHASLDVPALQAKERVLLQRLRTVGNQSEDFHGSIERLAQHVEAMARGEGPSVAEKLEQEAEQPTRFERRQDDDDGKSEPED